MPIFISNNSLHDIFFTIFTMVNYKSVPCYLRRWREESWQEGPPTNWSRELCSILLQPYKGIGSLLVVEILIKKDKRFSQKPGPLLFLCLPGDFIWPIVSCIFTIPAVAMLLKISKRKAKNPAAKADQIALVFHLIMSEISWE